MFVDVHSICSQDDVPMNTALSADALLKSDPKIVSVVPVKKQTIVYTPKLSINRNHLF